MDDLPAPGGIAFWVRASAGGVGFGLSVLAYLVLRVVPLPRRLRRQWFARIMSRLCCRPVGLHVRIVNGEQMRRHHPCIYVSNHQSQLDYPILARIYPGDALVIASQIGDWPILGPLFRDSGSLVLDRDEPGRAAATVRAAERALTVDRLSVWIFVEGTRGRVPGTLGAFKRGAFRLSARTGAPIVPIVVSPLKPLTDLRGRRLSPRDVTVTVLPAVTPPAEGDEDTTEAVLRERVRDAMARALVPTVSA
jgi:1-acyl-sn-glycerol-3-phosphate acyltransferase